MKVKMQCQGCARSGLHALDAGRPSWCRCRRSSFGPIVAAPGTVIMFRFESHEAAEFRERCRLAGNAEYEARHAIRDGRWVRAGRGYRRLPDGSKRVRELEAAHDKALASLEALQAVCPHTDRCPYNRENCGTCYAHVESDIAQHRHLVREGFYEMQEKAS